MHPNSIPLIDIAQIAAIVAVVTIWLVSAPALKSPWIPASNFSRVSVVVLVFLYGWNRFVAETVIQGEPIYVWYGLVLIIGIFAHWAKMSRSEPNKRTELW